MDCKIVARNIQKKFVKFADKFFCGKTKTINKENFKKNVYKRSWQLWLRKVDWMELTNERMFIDWSIL